MSSTIQRSFGGGELAPALYGRADQSKYQGGARTLRNFVVQRHGGASNRPGSRFVIETKSSAKASRLIKFVYSSTQTYVIEAGDFYFRFIQSGAQIVTSGVAAWNGATAYVVGDLVTSGGVTYYCTVAHTNQVPPNVAYWYAQSGTIYEIPTPYAVADLFALQFVQSKDVVTIVHPSYQPRQLRRTGTTAWTLIPQALAPTIAFPLGCGAVRGAAGGNSYQYRISAVATDTQEESLPGYETAKAITGATQANPCQVTAVAHGYTTGDEVNLAAILGMTQLNGQTVTITVTGANTFTLNGVDSTAYTAYASGGTSSRTYARVDAAAVGTVGAPITISWTSVAGATEYNIYRLINGAYGFIGIAQGNAFSDIGYTPDFSANGGSPPATRNLFGSAGNYPSTVAYTQRRLVFANSTNDPEKLWASRVAAFLNFASRSPVQDDDPIIFTLSGNKSNPVRNLVEVAGKLVVLTDAAEWTVGGNADGVLTPSAPNPLVQGFSGSNGMQPIGIGASALFVQARGSVVRDLRYSFESSGYQGNDLTVFSTHLFEGKTLLDWDYAQIPNSVVWAVRSDGILLGLTYQKEQNMNAWHRHDTDGYYEAVTVVPEGSEDYVYVTVRRTIGGVTKRYIERFSSRFVSDITTDAFFVDSGLTYNGWNTGATTMTLSLGTGWTVADSQTLTASVGTFTALDVGNAIVLQLKDSTGLVIDTLTATIVGYTSATIVTVTPSKNVPATFQGVAFTTWGKAVKAVTGMSHLEGKTVSVLGDGNVDPQKVVTAGGFALSRPFVVVHAGLAYTSELESLDIENLNGETLADKAKRPNRVGLLVESSRGIFAGLSGGPLYEYKQRATENYGQATALKTGLAVVPIPGAWQDNARVVVRQTDPLPLTVLALVPSGLLGG